MIDALSPSRGLQLDRTVGVGPAKPDVLSNFGAVLDKAMNEVASIDAKASTAMTELAAGRAENVHDVMIALEKSKIALNFAVEVRNKAIEAYKEIMRMQI